MSDLRRTAATYLEIRRSLGFRMKGEEKLLAQFIAFLEAHNAPHIRTDLALQWATLPEGCHPGNWRRRLCVVRPFARYAGASDPRTEIPPTGVLTQRYPRKKPHIYTDAEIVCLVNAARQSRAPKGLWGWTFSTAFGLMAATGIRVAESVRLDKEDVDLGEGLLTIRETKFRKSRLVPVHPSTAQALRRYSRIRDKTLPNPRSGSFLLSEQGKRVTAKLLGKKFLALARKIGLRGPKGTPGPRLHDLRHTFTTNAVLRWYRAGVNVEAHMPELCTYLGHLSTAETYWYISAIPELLSLAAKRLDEPRGE